MSGVDKRVPLSVISGFSKAGRSDVVSIVAIYL